MKKKYVLSVLIALFAFAFPAGVLTARAKEADECILLSCYGSGSVSNVRAETLGEGEGIAVFLRYLYCDGSAEKVGFALSDGSGEGAEISLSGDGLTASGGKTVYGEDVRLADLFSQSFDMRGAFYPSEGRFVLQRRAIGEYAWSSLVLVTGLDLPSDEVRCGLSLEGSFDLYLEEFRVEKLHAAENLSYTSENLEWESKFAIGAGSDFAFSSEKDNAVVNRYPFAAGKGKAFVSFRVNALSADWFAFGSGKDAEDGFASGVRTRFGESGFSDVGEIFLPGAFFEAEFDFAKGAITVTRDGEEVYREENVSLSSDYAYAGIAFSAGTQADFSEFSVRTVTAEGELLALGGEIALESGTPSREERTDGELLYSFGGKTYYPRPGGGYYTVEEIIERGDNLNTSERNISVASGKLTGGGVGYVVSEPVDLTASGMSVVMEYRTGAVDTSAVSVGNWVGIVVTDALPAGDNLYTTNPLRPLMAFPKEQQWQAGLTMDEALKPDTLYRATYTPEKQSIVYEYQLPDGGWRAIGNGIYLPTFGNSPIRLDNSNIYMGFQVYEAPVELDLDTFEVYTKRTQTVETDVPSLGDVTRNAGFIANAEAADVSSARLELEFDVDQTGGEGSVCLAWNDEIVNPERLSETLFGEHPSLSLDSGLFERGGRYRAVYDPKGERVSLLRRGTDGEYTEIFSAERLAGMMTDVALFGLQFDGTVGLEVSDLSFSVVKQIPAERKVYVSRDANDRTMYIAESEGRVSHANALEAGEGGALIAEMTVEEFTAPADRILVGEDAGKVLAPWFEVRVSSVNPIEGAPDGFGVRWLNTTSAEYFTQTVVVGASSASVSRDLAQSEVFGVGKLRFSYIPSDGVFTVSADRGRGIEVLQTVRGLTFRADRYFISFGMQEGIKLTTNDLTFYASSGAGAETAYGGVIRGDAWTGDGRNGESIVKTRDAGLTLTGSDISEIGEYRSFGAASGASGYADPKIYSQKADISAADSSVSMEFTVLSYEDLARTINYVAFGLVSDWKDTCDLSAKDTADNVFVCYRPAYGVEMSYYHSHFAEVVPGQFLTRHVAQSNFLKSGADVRITWHNGGGLFDYPYYTLEVRTAGMRDYEVIQYIFAMTGMPKSGVQMVLQAASNSENPGVNTRAAYTLENLRFYVSGRAEELEYEGTGDAFVGLDATVRPVTVSVRASDTSLGEVLGGGTFLAGQTVFAEAAPGEDAIFEGWYLETPESLLHPDFLPENRLSGESAFEFTLGDTVDRNDDFTLVARFVPAVTGTVITRGEQTVLFGKGLTYTVSANAQVGWRLARWELDGEEISANADGSVTFVPGERDFRLEAFYEKTEAETGATLTVENKDKRNSDIVTAVSLSLVAIVVAGIAALGYVRYRRNKK